MTIFRKRRKWVYNLWISQKYALVLGVVILSLCASGLYTFLRYRTISLYEQIASARKDFQQMYVSFDDFSTRLLHMTTLLQNNESVNRILAADPRTTLLSKQAVDMKPVIQFLKTMEDGTEQYTCTLYVDSSLAMSERGDILFPIGNYIEEPWMQRALTGWGWTFFATSQELGKDGIISIIRPIRSLDNYKTLLSVLRMDVSLDWIEQELVSITPSGCIRILNRLTAL